MANTQYKTFGFQWLFRHPATLQSLVVMDTNAVQ